MTFGDFPVLGMDGTRVSRLHFLCRAVLGGALLFYVLWTATGPTSPWSSTRGLILSLSVALGLLGALTPSVRLSQDADVDRLRGLVGDCLLIGAGMIAAPLALSWGYVLLVWTVISSSLRYGRRFLVHGVVLGLVTFSIVIAFTPFWREIYVLTIGLWLGLIVMPGYFWLVSTALAGARDDAQRANAAKGRFLANMSHELRTPLNGIQGMSDLMSTCDLPVDARGYLDGIQGSARHMESLVQHLLHYTAVDAGKIQSTNESFDLRALVERVMATVRPTLLRKGLEERVSIAADLPSTITTDADHLRRVLLSVVENAVKFTNEGHVTVDVSRQLRTDDRGFLHVRVRDSGVGISEEGGRRMFEPFELADDSASRPQDGTGLGMAIAKRLVEVHEGSIGFRSTPDTGSEFWFTFGFEPADAADAPAASPATASGIDVHVLEPARSLHILVVDDNESNRIVAETILRKAGHAVVSVASGLEAIDQLRLGAVELALLDLHMPGMSGLEVVRWIRARELGFDLTPMPVLILTADATEQARTDALASGVTGVLTKPISMLDLVRQVNHLAPPLSTGTLLSEEDYLGGLQASMENDGAFLSYLDTAINDALECAAALRNAVETQNLDASSHQAHSLKGVSSNLGLTTVSGLSAGIEQQCRGDSGTLPSTAELARLDASLAAGIEEIRKRFVRERSSATS